MEEIIISPLEVVWIGENMKRCVMKTKSWSNVYHVLGIIEALECHVIDVVLYPDSVWICYESNHNRHKSEIMVTLITGGQ